MMKKRYFRIIFFIIAFWILSVVFPLQALALEKTFSPHRDTYVKPGGGEDHGFEPILLFENVKGDNFTWRSYVFIIFEIASLPEEAIIDKATLSLNLVEDKTDNCSVQVQRQGDAWNEHENYFSLGYYNTETIYDIAYIVDTGLYNWEITPLVSEWHSGKFSNYGVVMFATDECRKSFASRQHDNQNLRPELIVSYHFPPTPTPTTTPTSTPSPTPTPKPSPQSRVAISPSPTVALSPTLIPTPSLEPIADKTSDNKRGRTILLLATGLVGLTVASFFIWKNKEKIFKRKPKTEEEITPENKEVGNLKDNLEERMLSKK